MAIKIDGMPKVSRLDKIRILTLLNLFRLEYRVLAHSTLFRALSIKYQFGSSPRSIFLFYNIDYDYFFFYLFFFQIESINHKVPSTRPPTETCHAMHTHTSSTIPVVAGRGTQLNHKYEINAWKYWYFIYSNHFSSCHVIDFLSNPFQSTDWNAKIHGDTKRAKKKKKKKKCPLMLFINSFNE